VRPIPNKPSLIVCPASVVPVWQQEIERFFPEFETAVLGKGQQACAFAFFKPVERDGDVIGGQRFRTGKTGAPLLESGVASAEDIDRAMQLGCNWRMGPLQTADLAGLFHT